MNLKPLFSVDTGVTSSGTVNMVKISNPTLFGASVNITSSQGAGATIMYVQDTTGILVNDLVLIGSVGSSNIEISRVTAKAATTLTVGTTSFYHSAGESITVIPYNAITVSTSTSKNGTYASIVTNHPIDFTALNTVYVDRASTPSTWYKVTFNDSLNSKTSGESDPVQGNGYREDTLEYVIKSVRNSTGNTSLTDDFFVGAVNEARRFLNTSLGYGQANAWRAEFNYPVQLLAGTNYIDLPDDIDFRDTSRSVLGARFSRFSAIGFRPLEYVDKRRWNQLAYNNTFAYTTTDTVANGTATSLTLSSVGDFATNGGVNIGTSKVRQSIINSNYSSINVTTNTVSGLSGLTRSVGTFTVTIAAPGVFTCTSHGLVEGDPVCFTTTGALPTGLDTTSVFYVTGTSLTANTFTVSATKFGATITTSGAQAGVHTLYDAIPAGTQVWSFQTNALPVRYTVFKSTVNGETKNRLWFEAPIPTTMQGRLIYLDYYKALEDVRSMSDVLEEPFRDCYADYVRYAMKRRRDDTIGENDVDLQKFLKGAASVLGNNFTGQQIIAITG